MAKTKKGFLSASAIKIIAVIAMIFDHASVIFTAGTPIWPRLIGRLAFPIFAFLLAEGIRHTKSRFRYLLRMLAFAFLSEIPFDWVLHGNPFDFSNQNVYFTLFLGLCSAMILDILLERRLGVLGIFSTVLFASAAMLLKSDYGFMGVVVITLIFMFSQTKNNTKYTGIALSCAMTCFSVSYPLSIGFIPQQIFASAAVLPVALYNGKRGFKINKYVFYLIYPLHLLLLMLIKMLIA